MANVLSEDCRRPVSAFSLSFERERGFSRNKPNRRQRRAAIDPCAIVQSIERPDEDQPYVSESECEGSPRAANDGRMAQRP